MRTFFVLSVEYKKISNTRKISLKHLERKIPKNKYIIDENDFLLKRIIKAMTSIKGFCQWNPKQEI